MIDVTCAIIEREGKVLIAKRKQGQHLAGKWEFPGGKLEAGETPEECLKRELKEEFGIETLVLEFLAESCFDYKEKSIRLLGYRVQYVSGQFILAAHEAIEWVEPSELSKFDIAEADIPIVQTLVK